MISLWRGSPLRLSLVGVSFLLFSGHTLAQQNTTQNSGDCTVLVQGSNNNITISSPCAPTKNLVLASNEAAGQKNGITAGTPNLQFTIREFVIDAHTNFIYVSMAVINRAAEPALVQLITRVSSIELSDPPASISVAQVQGLGHCDISSNSVRLCLDRAADIDSTEIPGGGTLGFRLIGRHTGRSGVSASTSGALSLEFMRKIDGKYEKLDLSFLDVKLSESR